MPKGLGFAVIGILICSIQQQPQQSPVVTVAVKGVIVAYHGQDRAFNVEEDHSIGRAVERWIVRVNDSDPKLQNQLILVQYQRVGSRMSEEQIEGGPLLMKLTQSPDRELRDCFGITFIRGKNFKVRKPTIKDFKKTSFGKDVKLPNLDSLPCFTTTEQPDPASGGAAHP